MRRRPASSSRSCAGPGARTCSPTWRWRWSRRRSPRHSSCSSCLLIEGWRLSPIGAAIVVSVMPLSALAGSRLGPLVPSAQGARRRRGDPRLRRPRRAGAATPGGGGADPAAPGPGRRGALAGALGTDRDRPRRPRAAGDPRRLDDLRPPRGGRHRAAGADPDLHRRHRPSAQRRDRRGHRRDPRFPCRSAAEDRTRAADRGPAGRGAGEGADDRPGLRPAAQRSRREGRSAAAAQRTPGPARPRRHPRFQPVVPARSPARPAGPDPDRASEEGGIYEWGFQGADPGRGRDRRCSRAGRCLPGGGRLLLRAGEDPGPLQAPALAQPGRHPGDRRAVLALGARRRRLQAGGRRGRRWPRRLPARRRGPASAAATGSATRSWRKRSGPAWCARSTTPNMRAPSAPFSPCPCEKRCNGSRSTRRSNWSRTPARCSATPRPSSARPAACSNSSCPSA